MTITNGYITLAELKNYLKIDDSVEDTLLEQIIEAASRSIDKIANRRFYLDANTSARTYYVNNPMIAIIDDIGTATGLVVKVDPNDSGIYQSTLTITKDFVLQPTNAFAKGRPVTTIQLTGFSGWGFPLDYRPQLEVTAKWGWPSVPDDIAQACYILSADYYKRKDSVGGVLGLSEMGAIRMSPLGRDIASIVRAYRREFFS